MQISSQGVFYVDKTKFESHVGTSQVINIRKVYQLEQEMERHIKSTSNTIHLFQTYIYYLHETTKKDPLILSEEECEITEYIESQILLVTHDIDKDAPSVITLSNRLCILLLERRIFLKRLFDKFNGTIETIDSSRSRDNAKEAKRLLNDKDLFEWNHSTWLQIHQEQWNHFLEWLIDKILQDSITIQKSKFIAHYMKKFDKQGRESVKNRKRRLYMEFAKRMIDVNK